MRNIRSTYCQPNCWFISYRRNMMKLAFWYEHNIIFFYNNFFAFNIPLPLTIDYKPPLIPIWMIMIPISPSPLRRTEMRSRRRRRKRKLTAVAGSKECQARAESRIVVQNGAKAVAKAMRRIRPNRRGVAGAGARQAERGVVQSAGIAVAVKKARRFPNRS